MKEGATREGVKSVKESAGEGEGVQTALPLSLSSSTHPWIQESVCCGLAGGIPIITSFIF